MNFKDITILAKTTGNIDHWMKEATKTCTHSNNLTEIRDSKQDNHGTNQHSPKRQGHQNIIEKRPYNIWQPSYPKLRKTDCVG
jgi:hypothetical protein